MAKSGLTLLLVLAACAPVSPPADTYRALGTEPFWALEIGAAEMVFTEANAPGVRIVESTPRPTVGFSGRTYRSGRLRATIVDGVCSDGMSDRTYPDRVELTVDGRKFEGCGGLPPPGRR